MVAGGHVRLLEETVVWARSYEFLEFILICKRYVLGQLVY